TVRGSNLATNSRLWEDRDFVNNKLPTSLDGTSVKINNKDAYINYISPLQLNVLSPLDSTEGPVQVTVTTTMGTSQAVTATMQRFSPAFLIFNNDKYIAARHADFSLLGPTTLFPGQTTPARPDELVLLYGTGFGPTDPAIPNGEIVTAAGRLTNPVVVRIGGVQADVQFAGQSSTGLYQFNVRVPAATPNGDAAVAAEIGGIATAPNTFINVQR
ncbi:MAG: hypothetical protein ACRD8O_06725, partial [Bryobacteraceae bacterium]